MSILARQGALDACHRVDAQRFIWKEAHRLSSLPARRCYRTRPASIGLVGDFLSLAQSASMPL